MVSGDRVVVTVKHIGSACSSRARKVGTVRSINVSQPERSDCMLHRRLRAARTYPHACAGAASGRHSLGHVDALATTHPATQNLQWVFASQTVPHHPTTGHGEGCAPCCWWHAFAIALLSGTDRGGRRSAAVMLYKVFLVLKSAAKRAVAACAACCSSTPLDRRDSLRAEASSNRWSNIVIESVAMYRCGSVPWPKIRPASQKQQL